MGNSTFNAFISRGIDSLTARQLIVGGYTLSSLKMLKETDLKKLNISDQVIEVILKEQRPPIPYDTIIKLLYETKRTCCVCRDNTKSIIIHHIEEWHVSRSHDESNLVVLCLQHHDEAHSKKALSLNLTPKELIAFKNKWIESVKTQDAKTILGLMSYQSRWDYVNLKRVFELFLDMNIDASAFQTYFPLVQENVIDRQGIILPVEAWNIPDTPKYYLCDFSQGIYLIHYLKSVVGEIVKRLPLIDITNDLNISFVKSVVKPGSFITGQLGYYFSDIDKFDDKRKRQIRKVLYRGNSIRIEFSYDAWHCTSNSARFDALTGHKVAVPILFVRSIVEDEDKNLVITGSCLAIGTWFENHREQKIPEQ